MFGIEQFQTPCNSMFEQPSEITISRLFGYRWQDCDLGHSPWYCPLVFYIFLFQFVCLFEKESYFEQELFLSFLSKIFLMLGYEVEQIITSTTRSIPPSIKPIEEKFQFHRPTEDPVMKDKKKSITANEQDLFRQMKATFASNRRYYDYFSSLLFLSLSVLVSVNSLRIFLLGKALVKINTSLNYLFIFFYFGVGSKTFGKIFGNLKLSVIDFCENISHVYRVPIFD